MARKVISIIIAFIALVVGGVLLFIGYENGDFNKYQDDIEKRTFEITEEIKNFDIHIKTSDLIFKKSEDGKNQVTYDYNENNPTEVSIEGDKLLISQTNLLKWYMQPFHFQKNAKIVISLNETTFDALDIEASTGDITLGEEYTFNNVKIALSTGDIKIYSKVANALNVAATTGSIEVIGLNCESLTLTSSTGRIKIENVDVSQSITTTSSTGKSSFKNVTANNVAINNNTGDINLVNTFATGELTVTTKTGDIKFTNIDSDKILMESGTGDIEGTVATPKRFYASSKTGTAKVPETNGGEFRVTTRTGDIDIKIVE